MNAIAKQRVGPTQRAGEAPRIGVEQKLVRIETMTVLRIIGSVGTVAVNQTKARIGEIAVPDLVGAFRQIEARDFAPAGRIEQTKLDSLGMRREDRKIGAESVPGGAKWIGRAAIQLIWKC